MTAAPAQRQGHESALGGALTAARRAFGTDRLALAIAVAAGVALLGLVGSVAFGALWWNVSHGEAARVAQARDHALAAGRQIAVDLQTVDAHQVDKSLDTWEVAATGPLLAELRAHRAQYVARLNQAQTSATARLVEAAVSDLDVSEGKATVLAAVDVSATQVVNGVPSLPATKEVRIALGLVRTPAAGWKAASAASVPPDHR